MISLSFQLQKKARLQVLCLGAHSDDIEIGCGGTILQLIATYPEISIAWVVLSASSPKRKAEALESANALLSDVKHKKIMVEGFRDSFFPYMGMEIKQYFETLKIIEPNLIFTHYRNDAHQDHQLVSNLTWNTFRDHLILEYEIPKYDGDLGNPNVFVNLAEDICEDKSRHILRHFKTQKQKHWFRKDTFTAVARLRGIESGSLGKYAEAFYCRKILM